MGAMAFLTALLLRRLLLAPYPPEVSGKVTLKTAEHLAVTLLALVDEALGWGCVLQGKIEFLVLGSLLIGIVLLSPDVVPEIVSVRVKAQNVELKHEPSVYEVEDRAVDNRASQGDAYIRPTHSRVLGPVD